MPRYVGVAAVLEAIVEVVGVLVPVLLVLTVVGFVGVGLLESATVLLNLFAILTVAGTPAPFSFIMLTFADVIPPLPC